MTTFHPTDIDFCLLLLEQYTVHINNKSDRFLLFHVSCLVVTQFYLFFNTEILRLKLSLTRSSKKQQLTWVKKAIFSLPEITGKHVTCRILAYLCCFLFWFLVKTSLKVLYIYVGLGDLRSVFFDVKKKNLRIVIGNKKATINWNNFNFIIDSWILNIELCLLMITCLGKFVNL